MHQIMNALQARLCVPGTSRASLTATMGDPDEVGRPGTELWSYANAGSQEASEMLVYHWRGRHDFLYFLVRGDHVVRARWWMAGE